MAVRTSGDLPRFINPEAEHILDWFHIAMKLTVMGQTTKGLGVNSRRSEDDEEPETLDTARILKNRNSSSGISGTGMCIMPEENRELGMGLENWEKDSATAKLRVAVREFGRYIRRIRARFPITATGIVMAKPSPHRLSIPPSIRSISWRMVKRQQMRWTKRGAHLWLQVRARALNNEPSETFQR